MSLPRTARTALLVAAVLGGAALCALHAPAAAAAPATPADTPNCVAVLKLHSEELARQVRGGHASRRDELRLTLRQGAAFVGEAWLNDSLGDEDRAKQRLRRAEAAVRQLDAASAAALRAQCSARADGLIHQAAGWQQMVIDRFAQSRMDRLLRAQQ